MWRYQYNTEVGHDVNRVGLLPELIMGTASEGVRNKGNR